MTARRVWRRVSTAGQETAARILRARQEPLQEILAALTARQRAQLADIARRVLRPQVDDEQALAHLCRLCDRARCGQCPVHAGYLDRCAAGDRGLPGG